MHSPCITLVVTNRCGKISIRNFVCECSCEANDGENVNHYSSQHHRGDIVYCEVCKNSYFAKYPHEKHAGNYLRYVEKMLLFSLEEGIVANESFSAVPISTLKGKRNRESVENQSQIPRFCITILSPIFQIRIKYWKDLIIRYSADVSHRCVLNRPKSFHPQLFSSQRKRQEKQLHMNVLPFLLCSETVETRVVLEQPKVPSIWVDRHWRR